jgi:hypothetical protein
MRIFQMKNVQKVLGIMLLVGSATSVAMANVSAPEIAAGTAGSALALVSGIVLMVRGRRK